jgi:site-specific recombinase XerD
MIEQFYTNSEAAVARLHVGPLSPHIEAFAALLWERGYARETVQSHLHTAALLSRWLARGRIDLDRLDERRLEEFVRHCKRSRPLRRGAAAGLQLLLTQLREAGVVARPPSPVPANLRARIERDFACYLAHERGLAQPTVVNYLPLIRRFLAYRFGSRPIHFAALHPQDTTRFLLRVTPTVSPARAKLFVTALRAFYQFLRLRGLITTDLAAAIPSVADWRAATLPKALDPAQVERLLAGCDQRTATGQRDYAILLLLARLGLRAGEVVALTLDDLDWETATITVQGKGAPAARLPLSGEVGAALARYLRDVRPACATRRVFVRIQAPRRGFASSVALCDIVRRALVRADLDPPRKGAHLLRHGLAIRMLRRGASLAEIGECLRHRVSQTTEIYAKVDLAALRPLAQRWPGGAA